MRRYTLNISDKEFVLDVQELAADRFEVIVGGETYEVSLANDESLAEAVITPAFDPGAHAPRASSSAARLYKQRPGGDHIQRDVLRVALVPLHARVDAGNGRQRPQGRILLHA